ncbi:hypothetical protein [Nostoc mirabile]|uniref:hypothetical protein n=1 Tax=Nostoc mirabile TaxID=2907820 RepID=UPI001E621B3C|nr:hypothetical protein [Nostoc mirabile]
MDCTTLALVNGTQGQSTSLLAENQDCGVEQKDCHEGTDSAAPIAQNLTALEEQHSLCTSLKGENQDCGVEMTVPHEGSFSAASVAQNEFSSSSAIANQTQGQVEQGYSATLLVENSVSGVEIKAVHEGTCSAAPVPQPEKWSHEAIVARSNVRPLRMQKLKVAANSGQNPGFDFLLSCWNDDPALVIIIKKLLAKFPQWGVACVDGVLVEWEE